MKRILTILLCILLAVGLAACALIPGESETTAGETPKNPTPNGGEETTTQSPEETTTAAPPQVEVPQNPFDENGFPNVGEDGETKRY